MDTVSDSKEVVPLYLDGVLVGKVSGTERGTLTFEITAPQVQSYLVEMMLLELVDGISLTPDYTEEQPDHVPERGHLRLVRSNYRGNEAAEATGSSGEAGEVRSGDA